MAVVKYIGGFKSELAAWHAIKAIQLHIGNELRSLDVQYNKGNWWALGVQVEANAAPEVHNAVKEALALGSIPLCGQGYHDIIGNSAMGRLGFYGDMGWEGFDGWIRVTHPEVYRGERKIGGPPR